MQAAESMDLASKTLWQVGAGDTDRSYGEYCKHFDVMIAGPGDPGPYEDSIYADVVNRSSLRRFCTEARRGDIVALRLGTNRILAVGEIADDASEHLDAFSDIDGWDLQHVRRVRWFRNTDNDQFPQKIFGGQVRTFAKVNVAPITTWIEGLNPSEEERARDLAALPTPGAKLEPDELGKLLFIEGLSSEYVDKLMAAFASLQRIASWYANETKRPERRPSEQETVCYLIIPLLLSLGWSQQTAAIQWRHVDVALFSGMPPTDETLACVVEAKLLGRSVFFPTGQARDYALQPGRENCKKLIVTDGIRYALHGRLGDEFKLEAYLNILNLRDSYPVLGCAGAVEAVLGMAR